MIYSSSKNRSKSEKAHSSRAVSRGKTSKDRGEDRRPSAKMEGNKVKRRTTSPRETFRGENRRTGESQLTKTHNVSSMNRADIKPSNVEQPGQSGRVEYTVVKLNDDGQRLDNFLISFLKGVPKTLVYRIVRKGEVRVNKGRAKPQYRVQTGDSIRIPPIRRSEIFEDSSKFDNLGTQKREEILSAILYEDDAILVLNKPSGIACHGGSGLSFGVIELLRHLKPNLFTLELVHRLDKDTSGCLLLAKGRKTLVAIQEQLKQGQVDKRYLALVKGQWKGNAVVDLPLKKNQLQSGERIVKVHPEGQASKTEFAVLERFPMANLMEAKPITGRTHQIRVHATAVGNPIALDPKYGDEAFDREMKGYGLRRLFLHAESLSFVLPGTEQRVTFVAPLDPLLQEVLVKLRG